MLHICDFVLRVCYIMIWRSYLTPPLCSCAISLVVVLLSPVGITVTIPITLLAIPLLRIALSIVGLLTIT
jgi:hypothetical protein